MLYSEYMRKVKDIALDIDEDTNLTYIRPDYEYLLYASGLLLSDVSDFETATSQTVYRELELECKMRNLAADKTPVVMQWMYDIISSVIEPAIIDEQNQLVKDLLEYRKERNAIDERTKELDQKQLLLDEKEKIIPMNTGMSFSKKRP